MNRTFMRMMAKSLFGAMPTRFAAVFVCEPPAIFQFVVWPFVRLLLPKKISERVQILPKEACEEARAAPAEIERAGGVGGTLRELERVAAEEERRANGLWNAKTVAQPRSRRPFINARFADSSSSVRTSA